MPSRFILTASIAIFMAILLLTVYYIETKEREKRERIKQCENKEKRIEKFVLKCPKCHHAHTYYNIPIKSLGELILCPEPDCFGVHRNVVEIVNSKQ